MNYAEQILNNIKIRLLINDDLQNELLKVLIEDTVQNIISYCNINDLPEELISTVSRLVVDEYYEIQAQQIGIESSQVSSMSDAGSSVSFFTLKTAVEISSLIKDKIKNLSILDKFKRLYKS